MPINDLENAIGFQIIDPVTGKIIDGGTFQNSTSPGILPNSPGAGPYSILGSNIAIGGQGGTILSTPGATATPNTTATNPAGNTSVPPTPALTAGSLADYFARAIIVILGFIFVAVGLNMLRPGTVPVPRMVKP